jgi:hypothetical protein
MLEYLPDVRLILLFSMGAIKKRYQSFTKFRTKIGHFRRFLVPGINVIGTKSITEKSSLLFILHSFHGVKT